MRNIFDNYSYLVPVSRSDLFINKIVYLDCGGFFLPRLVVAFDREKDTSIVLKNSHYVQVAYPISLIYEVNYL